MGKISVASSTKKADNVVGQKNNLPREKNTATDPTLNSPTPKNPLPKSNAGFCRRRRVFLFILGLLVVTVFFLSTACLLDYQQGNLTAHTSQLPRAMRDFPREVGKYGVTLLTETPKDLQKLFDVVVTKVKTWSRKTDEMDSTMKAWEQIKEGKGITIESLEAVINSEKSREAKLLVEETAADDKIIKEKSSLFQSLPPMSRDANVRIVADETVVEDADGLQGVADFFREILKDITSVFDTSEESTPNVGVDKTASTTRSPVEKYMVATNDIPRTIYKEDSAERASMTESGVFESHAQASKPDILGHTTESEYDWDKEAEVMEEIFYDNELGKSSSKEKLMNLLDVSDQAKHVHGDVE